MKKIILMLTFLYVAVPVRADSNVEDWWAGNATAEDWWLLRNYIYQLFESRVDEDELSLSGEAGGGTFTATLRRLR